MELSREELRTWLRQALARTGETPTGLARKAGLAQSTITRFLHSDDAPMLGLRSVAKIAHVTGVPPVGLSPSPVASSDGFGAGDGEPYHPGPPGSPFAAAVAAMLAGRNAVDPWLIRTRALDLAGYMPGDVAIVSLNETPLHGDVVCAQCFRWKEGKAETVFRIYEPPYLVAVSTDVGLRRPLLVDNDRVVIKGVEMCLLRPRRS